MMKPLLIALSLILAAGCSFARQAAQPALTEPSQGALFEFHNDPWVNLHHFVYHLARARDAESRLFGRVAITPEDLALMTPDFEAALDDALAAYQPYLDSSLLFDAPTRAIAKSLMAGPDDVQDAAVRAALNALMPHYQTSLWPRHQALNAAWLADFQPQFETHGYAMAQALAKALESDWADEPIRVDITVYSNWASAYTDHNPNSITVSSIDPESSGPFAYELIFHEAAHTEPLGDNLMPHAAAALGKADLESRNFWHYALFHITGRLAGETLGDPDYVPYAIATGLARRNDAPAFFEAMEAQWNDQLSLQDNLDRTARAAAESLTKVSEP